MSLLSRYVVPCITEGASFVSDYRSTPPTACPNNNTHVIDTDKIYIYQTMTSKTVTINQDSSISTGGYYRADQFDFLISGETGATASYDIIYPYNVGVYSVTLLVSPDNIGDSYDVISYPETPVGLLQSALAIGDTTFILPSVILLNPGFYISITDGKNTDDLGFIISVDETKGVINFSNPAVNSYDVGSTVLISVPRVKNGKFINNMNINLGLSKIGCAGLPAGKVVRFRYTNATGNPKTLNFIVELQF